MKDLLDDCFACELARVNPSTVHYTAGCSDCTLRGLAQGPDFYESNQSGNLTKAYRDALKQFFGEGWQEAHIKVKGWSALIRGFNAAKEAA